MKISLNKTAAALFFFLTCIVLAYIVQAQIHRHPALPDPTVELRSARATFPLNLVGGRPIVDVRVNGQGPFPFILDTGAEGTIVSDSLTEELKLEVLGDARVGSPGATRLAAGKYVRIGRIELGDLVLSGAGGVSVDLSPMSKVFGSPGAPRGVLSMKSWKGILVTLNYPAGQIELRHGELPAADDVQIFEFGAADRLPSVLLDVAGTQVRANLDSGAARGIMLPGSLASQLPLAAKPVEVESLRTVDGETPTLGAQLNGTVRLGRYVFENPDLNFTERAPIGNLGYPILRRFAVTLDWKNHRVRLEEPAALSE